MSKKSNYKLEYGNIRAELEKSACEVTLQNVRQTIINIREAKLPNPEIQGNAGSFFMNPIISRTLFDRLLVEYPQMPHYNVDDAHVKIPAAWMIDQCGWKGKQMGNVGVHDKQALVLVNCGGATGEEIVSLSNHIQQTVYDKFGIHIVPEVNFI